MEELKLSCCCRPTPFIETASKLVCGFAIIGIALSVIGLTATTHGPFSALVQWGITTNGTILGISTSVLIVDLVWIAKLCKNRETSHAISAYGLH